MGGSVWWSIQDAALTRLLHCGEHPGIKFLFPLDVTQPMSRDGLVDLFDLGVDRSSLWCHWKQKSHQGTTGTLPRPAHVPPTESLLDSATKLNCVEGLKVTAWCRLEQWFNSSKSSTSCRYLIPHHKIPWQSTILCVTNAALYWVREKRNLRRFNSLERMMLNKIQIIIKVRDIPILLHIFQPVH
jgi:hypothetical protein